MSAISGFCERCGNFLTQHCNGDRNTCMSILLNKIEAQQQEIDRLKELLADWKYNTKCNADHIAALIADKDEQMKRLEGGLKKLRSSFQWLSESIRDLGYRAWAEDNIDKINALLGGTEDVIPRH